MIKKIEIITNEQPQTELEKAILRVFNGVSTKLNEIIDAVNTIQKEREAERFEIQEWIGILEAVRKSVNVHEKQIDELQMKVEPEKCETRPENVQPDAKSRPENVQNKFAEQRRWIGMLCKFWFADAEHPTFGILDFVDAGSHPEPFHINCGESEQGWYPHCEPVKPDSDIIYNGE